VSQEDIVSARSGDVGHEEMRWRSATVIPSRRLADTGSGRMGMPTILIVEDERKLRELLRGYFERDGMTVLSAGTGAEGLSLALSSSPDLVVLDLGLPDVSGESVACEIRRNSKLPILMLTAKAEEEDRIRGLELGADDYVTKPFSPRELVLRVRAVLRRDGSATGKATEGVRSFGDATLVIDEPRRLANVAGNRVELTPTEWGILLALSTSPGRVYSRLELINRARGHEFEGYERSIDSHIKNLRRKIEPDPHTPRIVLTVLGGGYRFGLTPDA
jgi:DNA-binding response OmpR family regulator